jgi:oxygen-independent coproporphyrinogen-3 oxidase
MEALAPFSPSVEITLEVNPKTADLKKFREYLAAGVNRVSMGVQSLDDGILERLGRAHTAAEALQSLEGILETGFSRVNVDLMYGLPDQNPDNLHATLSRLGSYPLKHLSAYELIVEEETPFFEQQRLGQLRLPPTEEVLAMQRGIADFAKEHFLRPYEISNYAFRGHESRHNKNYWDYGSFLGLGAGAVSFLTREDLSPDFYSEFEKDAPREFYGFRFTHPRDLARYGHETRGGEGAAVEKISEETAMGEFMMMGLRKTEGIRYMDFEKKFFVPLPKKFSSAIEKMSERGWMLSDPQGCCLTAGGALLSNEVLQEFL